MREIKALLNPHQIKAALFALRNPLQEGVLESGMSFQFEVFSFQLWEVGDVRFI